MTRQNISDAIGGISDKYIIEALDPMSDGPHEVTEMKKHRSMRPAAVIAVAACLVFALSITAFATGIFGLDSITRRMSDGETVATVSAEADAAAEWMEYKNSHREELISAENIEWDILSLYGAYTDDAKDALKEIAKKHGLKLFTEEEIVYSEQELAEHLGTTVFLPPMSDIETPGLVLPGGGVWGHNSVYSYCANTKLENGKNLFYDFYSVADGYFLPPTATLLYSEQFTEETYSVSGVDVSLSLGGTRSYILADLDGGTVTIFIRAGIKSAGSSARELGADALTMDDLRAFADSIDFAAIAQGMK